MPADMYDMLTNVVTYLNAQGRPQTALERENMLSYDISRQEDTMEKKRPVTLLRDTIDTR